MTSYHEEPFQTQKKAWLSSFDKIGPTELLCKSLRATSLPAGFGARDIVRVECTWCPQGLAHVMLSGFSARDADLDQLLEVAPCTTLHDKVGAVHVLEQALELHHPLALLDDRHAAGLSEELRCRALPRLAGPCFGQYLHSVLYVYMYAAIGRAVL
jgi:hypothetical protein